MSPLHHVWCGVVRCRSSLFGEVCCFVHRFSGVALSFAFPQCHIRMPHVSAVPFTTGAIGTSCDPRRRRCRFVASMPDPARRGGVRDSGGDAGDSSNRAYEQLVHNRGRRLFLLSKASRGAASTTSTAAASGTVTKLSSDPNIGTEASGKRFQSPRPSSRERTK